VAPGLLRVGPYQGPLGCLEISFDRGVCGAAARERRSQLVPDVDTFPGHIACDAAARSEVVVPVDDAAGELAAVLDVDSHQPAAFDEEDRAGLEGVAAVLSRHLAPAAAVR
jgi:GAF domain-containing protein